MKIETNVWETAFFGRAIGQVICLQKNGEYRPLDPNQVSRFALLQAKIDSQDHTTLAWLQQQGFHWVEGEVNILFDLNDDPAPITLAKAEAKDLAELGDIFRNAFPQSRFRPPYFSVEENQCFYQHWISQAVYGNFDDLCLIERAEDGRILGGITLKIEAGQVKVGLLAVRETARRQGVGSRLLKGAMKWAKRQGVEHLHIATQSSNLAALNCYQRLGGRIERLAYWLYRNEHSF